MKIIKEIDARFIHPHAERPKTVFNTFASLSEGESMVLILDHDPGHLSGIIENLFPNQHSWEYHESGPELWRVEIGRKNTGSQTENIDGFVERTWDD